MSASVDDGSSVWLTFNITTRLFGIRPILITNNPMKPQHTVINEPQANTDFCNRIYRLQISEGKQNGVFCGNTFQ